MTEKEAWKLLLDGVRNKGATFLCYRLCYVQGALRAVLKNKINKAIKAARPRHKGFDSPTLCGSRVWQGEYSKLIRVRFCERMIEELEAT